MRLGIMLSHMVNRRRISAAVILLFEDDEPRSEPDLHFDVDVEAEELSAVHHRLAKCAAIKAEQKRRAR